MNQNDLLTYLKRHHTGRRKAVSSWRLEMRFCVIGSTLRRAVLSLRLSGYPICSGQTGYYYAANAGELEATIQQFERRLYHNARLRSAMGKAVATLSGSRQTSLLGEGGDAH